MNWTFDKKLGRMAPNPLRDSEQNNLKHRYITHHSGWSYFTLPYARDPKLNAEAAGHYLSRCCPRLWLTVETPTTLCVPTENETLVFDLLRRGHFLPSF